MRLTRELAEVVKAEVVSILKGYPAGLKAGQLYSPAVALFPWSSTVTSGLYGVYPKNLVAFDL
jgi:hypothetical protein